ncbi:IS1595 family transposase [Shimia sp.]|uniref:IS1595 family transposase n=1 Tax=Shimia sp. TaxID=1954381 RepID=UPI003BAD18EE
MKQKSFENLLKRLHGLTPDHAESLIRSVQDMTAQNAALGAIDQKARHASCPHCCSTDKQKWGRTRTGTQRYRCSQCRKTYNGRTDSSISRIQRLDLFYRVLRDMFVSPTPSSVRQLAKELSISKDTVWRWRQIILRSLSQSIEPLTGIVEVDETFVRESRKGSREWVRHQQDPAQHPRPPRLRWYEYKLTGALMKRGLSKWRLPVLTAMDRSGNRFAERLPDRRDRTIYQCLSPIIRRDAALCSDGLGAYAKFAQASGISHFVLGSKPGSRKIGQSFHIQNVNALHSRMKNFLRPFKGPAKKYLDGYVDWYFVRFGMEPERALNGLLKRADAPPA